MRTTAKLACLTLTLAALVAGLSYVQYGRLRRTVDQQLFCRVLPAYDENECDSSECPEVHIPSKIGSAPFRMVVYPAKDVVAGALLADSSWEPHGTLQICYAIIKTPGTTFVDIGANLGWYTLFAAAQVRTQSVCALIRKYWRNTIKPRSVLFPVLRLFTL